MEHLIEFFKKAILCAVGISIWVLILVILVLTLTFDRLNVWIAVTCTLVNACLAYFSIYCFSLLDKKTEENT